MSADARPADRRKAYAGVETVDGAFAAQVAATPDAIALVDDSGSITYLGLDRRADALARRLLALGVQPGGRVGIALPRSTDAIAALLAVLKLGCAYVPFDAAYPAATRRQVAEDCQPAAVIAVAAPAGAEPPFWSAPTLWLERNETPDAAPATPVPSPDTTRDSAAYVMFTSGSTGRPKGVVTPHRGIMRLVRGADYVDLGPGETLLQAAPLAFDASTFEIWGALLNGGRLVILNNPVPGLDDIAQAIARHGVTTLWLTAGLFHMMVEHRLEALRPLRQLLAGGDVLSPSHVRRALQALPQCRLINGYGPTENTTFTCCHTIPHDFAETAVPIGRAIAGTQVHVLDETMQPVADGEQGQLCAGGDGVALGYLADPARTVERFAADPWIPGGMLYLTGDLVRRRADGVVEFCGRADRQVKIDGKRVELDAIEAAVRTSGVVQEAAVTYPAFADGQRRLVCHVLPAADRPDWLSELRAHLKAGLPDHMVPARLVAVASFALTPSGKVDRRALPVPEDAAPRDAVPAVAGGAARDLIATLQAVWCRSLARDSVGLDDSFFDLGGTSLQLIGVHAELQRIAGLQLGIVEMLAHPTIRQLAARMQAQSAPVEKFDAARQRARRQADAIRRMQQRNGTDPR